ncbi:ABC transporter substrate-binding protein [Paenibacillus mesotrionivorans]|uniref:ABC transporter substrate-binding protein n=1 Tax=Paenibacillus mesotrionivorans TaxID=3160968 RepID=A0ACC7P4E3_9BACL
MKKNRVRVLSIGFVAGMMLAGCAAQQDAQSGAQPEVTATGKISPAASAQPASLQAGGKFTLTDDLKRTVVLERRPERIVVLSPEMLELMYAIGGTAAGRAEAAGIVPPKGAENVPAVGQMRQVSLEQVLALKPDLVIGQPVFHKDMEQTLTASGIPVAFLKLGSLEEVHAKTELLGRITGKETEAQKALAGLDSRVEQVLKKRPAKTPTFVNLNVTPGVVSIQRNDMAGLEIAKKMNLVNVAEELPTDKPDASTLPYSLEKLIEKNPDYIFLIIHGSKEAGEKKIKTEMESNPAWSSLKAVQEKKVIVMPSELFLTNPGLKYDESMTYLGQFVYPEAYGQPQTAGKVQ